MNIVVHSSDSSQPRYILSCENSHQYIHLSYHGDCHYNSVRAAADPDVGDLPLPIPLSLFADPNKSDSKEEEGNRQA